MNHAVGTFFIFSRAVFVPFRVFHELLECLRVALTQQIARLLPAEDVAGRISPRHAFIGFVAGEEIEEQAGLAEPPFLVFAETEYFAEQGLGL